MAEIKIDADLWRKEAGLGICTDPRREFGRDYRILALLDRVAELEAKVARVEAALADFRDHGLRADLTPTMPIQSAEDYGRWTEYLRRIDNAVRDRARAALLANGIEREPSGSALAGESDE